MTARSRHTRKTAKSTEAHQGTQPQNQRDEFPAFAWSSLMFCFVCVPRGSFGMEECSLMACKYDSILLRLVCFSRHIQVESSDSTVRSMQFQIAGPGYSLILLHLSLVAMETAVALVFLQQTEWKQYVVAMILQYLVTQTPFGDTATVLSAVWRKANWVSSVHWPWSDQGTAAPNELFSQATRALAETFIVCRCTEKVKCGALARVSLKNLQSFRPWVLQGVRSVIAAKPHAQLRASCLNTKRCCIASAMGNQSSACTKKSKFVQSSAVINSASRGLKWKEVWQVLRKPSNRR